MYQAVHYDYNEKTYYLRDDQTGWDSFKYYPTFYELNPKGQYRTIFGDRVSPTQKYSKDNLMFESDVDKVTRLLVDRYYDLDDTPSYHNLVYFDIECVINGSLTPELIKRAPNTITSIALYDNNNEKYYCFILDENNLLKPVLSANKDIIPCLSEAELLSRFLQVWKQIDPTIVIGYNSYYFDTPYLFNRINVVLGYAAALSLSPINKVKINDDEEADMPVEICGVNSLDFMILFKKYITKQEPSYKLGDIGEKYVELGKIEYYGNLDVLFREDPIKYVDYNLRDVEILIKLESKLKFIDLTIIIGHLCHVEYKNIIYSTTLNDGAILTYLKRKGIISPNKPTTLNPVLKDIKKEYAGGYLKDPIPGLYELIIDLDFTSLYPSIIRSLNIGIETLVGRIKINGKYDNSWTLRDMKSKDPNLMITIEKLTNDRKIRSTNIKLSEMISIIEDNDLIVSAAGVLFRKDVNSIVCEILTDWFNKRTEYKDKMKVADRGGDEVLAELYNRRQHAYKIKLNDVYGVFALNSWRYTDGHKMISEAITLTGQTVTKESIKFVNQYIVDQIKNTPKGCGNPQKYKLSAKQT